MFKNWHCVISLVAGVCLGWGIANCTYFYPNDVQVCPVPTTCKPAPKCACECNEGCKCDEVCICGPSACCCGICERS